MTGSGFDGNGNRRRDAWRKIHRTCECGKEVYGNGRSHFRSCEKHLEVAGWPMENSMCDAIRRDGYRSAVIRQVELGLGRIYLKRRAEGVEDPLPWLEYRDTVWRLVEEAAAA